MEGLKEIGDKISNASDRMYECLMDRCHAEKEVAYIMIEAQTITNKECRMVTGPFKRIFGMGWVIEMLKDAESGLRIE